MVKRTERGWPGHFCCADRCIFRRNTLLECNNIKVVVSTVGKMIDIHAEGYPNKITFDEIGYNRHYETMAFHAKRFADKYWDADVCRQIDFDSQWSISEIDADDVANDMHEVVVKELTNKLKSKEVIKKWKDLVSESL
jgi:hypothetical protein